MKWKYEIKHHFFRFNINHEIWNSSIINLKYGIRHEMFGFDTENKILNHWNENIR